MFQVRMNPILLKLIIVKFDHYEIQMGKATAI
jgi:hypothetical protein